MTPAAFIKTGEALYGPSWRGRLAKRLGVTQRTVLRWADGTSAIPPGIPDDMAKLCRSHSAKLIELADQIERAARM